eukprot:gene1581-1836_t
MEENCYDTKGWDGPLGFTIGGTLYADFTLDDKSVNCAETVLQRILNIVQPLRGQAITVANLEAKETSKAASEDRPIENGGGVSSVERLSKQLSELSTAEVGALLQAINFSNYKEIFAENEIDGVTLASCETADDIVSLGIKVVPKAKALLKSVNGYKSTGVPLDLLLGSDLAAPIEVTLSDSHVLDLITKYGHNSVHARDRDRALLPHSCWLFMEAFDWNDQPKGYVCDANRSVVVGLSSLTKEEDALEPSVLLVKHYDTTQRYKDHSHENDPAFWGISLTTVELKRLVAELHLPLGYQGNVLLHRNPYVETEEERAASPWLQETRLMIEGGPLVGLPPTSTSNCVGVLVSIRCTQDEVAREKEVRFRIRGDRFELESVLVANQEAAKMHQAKLRFLYSEILLLDLPCPVESCSLPEGTQGCDPSHWSSYEQGLAAGITGDGFGPDFQCDLFMSVAHPVSKLPIRIIITSARREATCWYVRVSSDRWDLTGSYSILTPSHFHRLAYQSSGNKTGSGSSGDVGDISEVEVALLDSNEHCGVWALVQSSSRLAFALKCRISVPGGLEVGAGLEVIEYMRLDYIRVVDSELKTGTPLAI